MAEPRCGEVWLVDLGLAAKVRPCLVVSIPAGEGDRALVTLVPHTTSVRSSRFEVSIKVGFLRAGAFDVQSLITIPHVKLVRKVGTLSRRISCPSSRQAFVNGLTCESESGA